MRPIAGRFPPRAFGVSGPYAASAGHAATVLTQLHCHTTASDGTHSPATIVSDYLDAGYGALAITDHDMVTSQPAGITTAITANELSPSQQHIISIGSSYTRSGETDAQTLIDAVDAAGGECHIAHPRWSTGMSYAEMAALTGYMGLEIHNGHCITGLGQDPITYPAFAIDRWDDLLTNDRTDVWGFAVDDLHTVGAFETYDIGRVQVFAGSNDSASIVAALAAGNFVADVSNHGVTPGFPVRTVADLSLTCAGASAIEAYGTGGVLLSSSAGDSITYTFDGDEQYVRLVAVGGYTEGFGSALSDRWHAYDGTWAATGGVAAMTNEAATRRLILRRHRQGDFTAQVDVKLTGANDAAALMFNCLSSTHFYMARIGYSATSGYVDVLAIAKTTTDSFAADGQLDNDPFTASTGTWYTIKVAYTASTGTIQAKVWDRSGAEPGAWMVSAADTTWSWGAFGFRGYGAPEFDNLVIDGFRTYYQPVAITQR